MDTTKTSEEKQKIPYQPNVYVRTFLGALLFLGLVFFYILHLSVDGQWAAYGEPANPAVNTQLSPATTK